MISKALIVGALVGGLIVVSAGCASIGEFNDGVTKLGQNPGAATPSATAEPIEGDENGDGELSEFEKQVLAQDAPVDYVMPDGSTVTIPGKGAVPIEVNQVMTEIAQPLGDQAKAHTTSSDVAQKVSQDARAMAKSLSDSIGRPVVLVLGKSDGLGNIYWGTVSSAGKATGLMPELSRDAVIAKTDSWAEPRGYEVVVLS